MRRIVAILVLGVLLASCSGAGDSTDSNATVSPPTTKAAATGTIDGMFDVGGHKLHLACQGSGSPTFVYLHGLGGDFSDAAAIYAPLTDRIRVCVFDRLNAGKSDSDAGRHTGADSVREMHALLDAAAIRGPTCCSASRSAVCSPRGMPARIPTRSWES